MTPAYLSLTAQRVLYLILLHCPSLKPASCFLPHPFRILLSPRSRLGFSLGMALTLSLFRFSSLRRCDDAGEQLHGVVIAWLLWVGVQVVVAQLSCSG